MIEGGCVAICIDSLVRMQSRNRYSVYEMMPGNETKTERVKEKVTFNTHTHTTFTDVQRPCAS